MMLTGFFLASWEEYHTGTLVHPIFSGPTEGLLCNAALFVFAAAQGTDIFTKSFWEVSGIERPANLPDVPLNAVLVSATLSFGLTLCLRNVVAVINAKSGKRPSAADEPGHGTTMTGALLQWSPFVLLLVINVLIALHQPGGPGAPNLFAMHPHVLFLATSFQFSRQVGYMIVSHLTWVSFDGWRVAPYAHIVVYATLLSGHQANPTSLLQGLLAVEVLFYLHFAISVVWAISSALDIPVFVLPKSSWELYEKLQKEKHQKPKAN
eukprot:TRINITY_DN7176_c0_g1_i1.p1 TRINITY_DN7176_c0_g1~~TRINITY_DN7176_c0_g1_i1.p1  ORF type:complete len:265 (-),score=53.18 TRINITY_DN7176_c0_g1_i1:45-839(-)